MNTQEKIDNIIKNSARYISSNLFCKEDNIYHRGRNSYLWTFLAYLYQKYKNPEILLQAEESLKTYKNCFKLNENKYLILLPGLNNRTNYSTNSIDCGIFLDCINDLRKIIKVPETLNKGAKEILCNYAFAKLKNRTPIHNQYLWLLSGFSRSINEIPKQDRELSKELIIQVINYYYSINNNDGSCCYSSLSDELNNITTYYHSRCLAFISFSLENINYKSKLLEDLFYKGALFLAKMYKTDGIKALSLESKRYYFHNNYELASTPYDIYVFEKAYNISKDNLWLELSANCLNQFIKSIHIKGFQQSKLNPRHHDWQCNIMRTTHHAWLTRLSNQFTLEIDKHLERKKIVKGSNPIVNLLIKDSNKDQINSNLLLVGNNKDHFHFLTNKSPISNLYGQRTIGLQPKDHLHISNLIKSFPYEYRIFSFKCFNKSFLLRDLSSIKGAILQIKESLLTKKNIKKALEIFNDHIISYLIISYSTLSTSFPLKIKKLNYTLNWLSHELEIADIKGGNKTSIGSRNIHLKKGYIVIVDFIEKNKFFYFVISKRQKYSFSGSYKVNLNFFKNEIVFVKGPCTITFIENFNL